MVDRSTMSQAAPAHTWKVWTEGDSEADAVTKLVDALKRYHLLRFEQAGDKVVVRIVVGTLEEQR